MKTTTVAEYLAKIFYKCGIRHVFFIPVIGVKLLKEMEKIGIKRIIPHSEKAAAYMADGYARIRKKPSLCMAQSVGSFNLASGLQDAFLCSSPVIAITGRRPGHEQQRNAYQEVDHEGIFKNITKYHNYLNSPEHTALVINQAIKESTSACPGPVHIDIGGFTGHGLFKSIITKEHKFYKQLVNIPPIRILPENKIRITTPSTIDTPTVSTTNLPDWVNIIERRYACVYFSICKENASLKNFPRPRVLISLILPRLW